MAKSPRYERDCLQLSLIAAVQYILGCLCLLLTLLCLPFCILMITAAFVAIGQPSSGNNVTKMIAPLVVSAMMLAIPAGLMFLFFHTAKRLKQHRSYHFCCFVLTVESFGTGLGLFLGIWFALVMNRQSVKDLFEAGDTAADEAKRLENEQRELQRAVQPARLPLKKADASLSGFREPERL